MTSFYRQSGLAAFALLGVGTALVKSAAPPAERPAPSAEQAAFFETKVRPLLAKECYPCHGPSSQSGGLRLDAWDSIAKVGVVVPGDPAKSPLIQAIHYTGGIQMPPSGRLAAADVATLEDWVKIGAPWPQGLPAKTAAPLWSLQPVTKPAPPAVRRKAWVRNPIDAFVLAKQEAKGLAPAPEADRRTLIRRLSYDLIGLPPTSAETDAFLRDKAPNAYERQVDRLLASPHYGERWARQWMDVARYADTKGYAFGEDRNYPNAYTYRSWLIDAFNRDLPYDRFITEQLAADRMPETQGDDRSALAAMGFLTLGRRFLNDGPSIIDDRIDVTMRGFQGLTVACARCHDHKFDPIPTQDYYSLYAVFDSSEERADPISPKSIRDPWERYNAQLSAAQRESAELISAQVKRLRTQNPGGKVAATLQGFREGDAPNPFQLNQLLPSFESAAAARITVLQNQIQELQSRTPATPEFAMAMADRSNPHDGVVFRRGNPGLRGDAAPRRFLLALTKGERPHWTDGSGRLQLAQAIASRENPLTARVFVNRLWMGHFGAGLVRTPSDFGHQGERPTHPELLDWLASSFMDGGWSIKRMQRLIVTSATYRQASDAPAASLAADPENRLLTRMNRRRLDLEQMRDSVMAAADRLDLKDIGGRSVDLWAPPFTPRRAVYGFVERQNLPGIFRTFDFASPDATSARRFQTTVPQQALFFMNSPFVVEASKALALRPEIRGAQDDAQRIRRLYLDLFDRLPDAEETAMGVAYLHQPTSAAPRSDWQYGFGGYDVAAKRTQGFTPLGFFGGAYQVGAKMPDPTLGYVSLNAQGGHPGRDGMHAAIRRWTAPEDLTLDLSGGLQHFNKQGDGVRGRVISNRQGLLGEWTAKEGRADTNLKAMRVTKGEILDFAVDPIGSDAFDSFAWSPTLVGGGRTWSAQTAFGPPPPPPLHRLVLYAQALMMTNEFMFVD